MCGEREWRGGAEVEDSGIGGGMRELRERAGRDSGGEIAFWLESDGKRCRSGRRKGKFFFSSTVKSAVTVKSGVGGEVSYNNLRADVPQCIVNCAYFSEDL